MYIEVLAVWISSECLAEQQYAESMGLDTETTIEEEYDYLTFNSDKLVAFNRSGNRTRIYLDGTGDFILDMTYELFKKVIEEKGSGT